MRNLDAKDGVRLAVGNKGLMLLKFALLSSTALARGSGGAYFSDFDRGHIQQFWNERGRFTVSAPKEAATKGPWQVRLTPEGSIWLYQYNRSFGLVKGSSSRASAPNWESKRAWDVWIAQRVSSDRYAAGKSAAEANGRFGLASPNPIPPADDPGPEPQGLRVFAGVAPSFAAAVAPNTYLVRFDDGETVTMSDNPPMRANYPSYRFPQGVMSSGTSVRNMPESELNSLFAEAGIDPSMAKVMKAVSLLEGGFDSINTYDTGFVSVGLIQFACRAKGAGSLGQVLLREKQRSPEAFLHDFHRFGLDVTPDGTLVAMDVDTGEVLDGPAAAQRIIDDKRLVAVFEHAGKQSRAFRVAQLQIAKEQYYPAGDPVAISVGGKTIAGSVSDFVHSEAGMATLMDRKVNTGRIDPLLNVLSQIGAQNNCQCAADFAAHEPEIIAAMRYRKDYTLDAELSQPNGLVARTDLSYTSRHGSRRGRGHR